MKLSQRCKPLNERHLRQLRYTSLFITLSVITALFSIGPSSAVPSNPELAVPAPLQPWLEWVAEGLPDPRCAHRAQRESCVWPTQLSVSLEEGGATFLMAARLDREGLLPLPYAGDSWPRELELRSSTQGGWRKVPILEVGGRPQLRLAAGEQLLRGRLSWSERPDWIQVPPEVGFARLDSARGQQSKWRSRDERGRLWLNDQANEAQGAESGDSLHMQVFRVFYDESPLRVETHLQLNTSGQSRQVTLSGLELEGSRLVTLRSELTAEWVEGALKLYLKPGRARLTLTSLISSPGDELIAPQVSGGELPPQEVWVWHNRAGLRAVSLSGLDSVDAEQTSLPAELRGGDYTFLAAPGQRLKITELSRGLSSPPPNKLNLKRHVWLDLDGEGFVSRDQLRGELNRGGRLNYRQTGELGSAQLKDGGPLLITQDPQSGQEGFELRARSVDVVAEIRAERGVKRLQAVGWDHPVSSLEVRLELPPGYRLLAVTGATSAIGAWVDSWRLIDLFLILLTAVVLKRLLGLKVAALSLCMLTLYHDAPMAPEWSWLMLCLGGVLLRVFKTGGLRLLTRAYSVTLALTLISLSLASALNDVRHALHPQLALKRAQPSMSLTHPYRDLELTSGRGKLNRNLALQQRSQKSPKIAWEQRLQQVDPNAVVQTGPGLPSWSWRSYHLSFAGTVLPNRELSLTLLTPRWERGLLALRAALLLGLLLLVLKWLLKAWRAHERSSREPEAPATLKSTSVTQLVLSLGAALLCLSQSAELKAQMPTQAQAQSSSEELSPPPQAPPQLAQAAGEAQVSLFPPAPLLEELKTRLKRERSCLGSCLHLSSFHIELSAEELSLSAELHAERASSFTLPGSLKLIHWREVTLKGAALPTRGELRGGELTLVARVPQGQHQIKARATLPALERLSVALYDLPKQLSVTLNAWRIESSQERVEGTLEFARERDPSSAMSKPEASSSGLSELRGLEWYRVERELIIGLPWQVKTTVRRPHTDKLGAQALSLSLIEGERLLSPEVELVEGGARVQFKEGERSLSFVSELSPTTTLELVAPQGVSWSEQWSLSCGAIWQCQWSGLNPDDHPSPPNGARWSPWPGERLRLSFSRPSGVKGAASTVRSATLKAEVGDQVMTYSFELKLHASRGGARTLSLAEGAQGVRLYVDQAERRDSNMGPTLRLPFKPGSNHFKVTWDEPWSGGYQIQSPQLSLDGELVNLNIELHKPSDRWLLWTSGPEWGPAVLIWGMVVLAFALALLLHLSGFTPLGLWAWLSLLLGFSQTPHMLIFVILWFLCFEARGRYGARLKPVTLNFIQLMLIGGTLIFLFSLYAAIHTNLISLGEIEMQVSGAGSTERVLKWYVDRHEGPLPQAALYTLPRRAWQILMLAWSFWLANSFIKWAQWAWTQAQIGGVWRSRGAPQSLGDDGE